MNVYDYTGVRKAISSIESDIKRLVGFKASTRKEIRRLEDVQRGYKKEIKYLILAKKFLMDQLETM